MLYYGGVGVGYVCWGARPGDVVASFNPGPHHYAKLHLVLRQLRTMQNTPDATIHEIVGQAVMATDTIFDDYPIERQIVPDAQTDLSFEDWAILWYQAPPSVLIRYREPLIDYRANAGRLFTSVSDLSKSGPRTFMTQHDEYNSSASEQALSESGVMEEGDEDWEDEDEDGDGGWEDENEAEDEEAERRRWIQRHLQRGTAHRRPMLYHRPSPPMSTR